DNMPFLFDSVISEITETAGEAMLVTHPVLVARHGKAGIEEIIADGGHHRADPVADKVSVIHVHIGRIGKDEAKGLNERLSRLLLQVKAAVDDWKPMLARLDQAISEFRYAPIPLDKEAV